MLKSIIGINFSNSLLRKVMGLDMKWAHAFGRSDGFGHLLDNRLLGTTAIQWCPCCKRQKEPCCICKTASAQHPRCTLTFDSFTGLNNVTLNVLCCSMTIKGRLLKEVHATNSGYPANWCNFECIDMYLSMSMRSFEVIHCWRDAWRMLSYPSSSAFNNIELARLCICSRMSARRRTCLWARETVACSSRLALHRSHSHESEW